MDNSLVTHLRGYYDALFSDIAPWYSDVKEKDRDLSRLLSSLAHSGSRVGTIDLPTFGKALEKSLELKRWTPSAAFFTEPRKGGCLPKFLGNVLSNIFSPEGVLRDDFDAGAVFAVRQVCLSLKKLELTCAKKYVYSEVSNFFRIEEGIKEPSLPWGGGDFDAADSRTLHLLDVERDSSLSVHECELVSRFQRVADILSSQFGDLHNEGPRDLPKHGPGVVSNARGGVSKYSFPEWPEKLDRVFPRDRYVHQPFGEWPNDQDEGMSWMDTETPSKLIAVPKTQKGPRLIAAEPIQNQWIQQLLWRQLESRLTRTSFGSSIQFRLQEANQAGARSGSIDGTLCTIDLSSASDRLSCWLVERVFRSNPSILDRLNACRTAYLSNGIDSRNPDRIRLRKFAAMGSACTFPVQSIVYAAMAISLGVTGKVTSRSVLEASRRVQVFGDDIILPSTQFESLVRLLTIFGLKVNEEKSFYRGPFRESCGGDYCSGVDVTPAYLRNPKQAASPTTLTGDIEVINNYFEKGLWHTSDYLRRGLARWSRFIPIQLASVVGSPLSLRSYSGEDRRHLRSRYNDSLHRSEFLILRSSSKSKEYETDGVYRLMKYLHEPSRTTVKWLDDGGCEDPIRRTLATTGRETSLARPGWANY